MYKKISKILGVAIILAGLAGLAFGDDTTTKLISASISAEDGLEVTISKINANGTGDPSDDTWIPGNQSSMAFGALTFNPTYSIFMASHYFAIDVGVNSNTANWTLSHTISSISNGAGSNLDSNVNVTFVQQLDSLTEGWKNGYSFADSNGKAYNKATITGGSGGWLRIYYGIATGDLVYHDNTGVSVITMEKPSGSYSGSITLTLTAS